MILLGYFAGPIYARTMDMLTRHKLLIGLGLSCLVMLLVLRGFDIYGEIVSWQFQNSALMTLMDFINYTKCPLSLVTGRLAVNGPATP